VTDQGPRRRESIDDLDLLLGAIPPDVVAAVHALTDPNQLIEVVMDLGRRPEARFTDGEVTLLDREITESDIGYVVDHIGTFGDDNRAGIERTLHRISAIRNRTGKIVGLTCRIGRAVYGTIEIINDFVESGKSILIMGRPGIGKTTMLREAARVLAEDQGKRVVVVDTSNEIAGDGDIPHPAIGRARRMQVKTPSAQHEVMIEAVENHMPEVIVIDEIGTELEAQAARTIAERGVQLIGTAHGNNLDNLMLNPTLTDLIGGIQTVTLGDEEARRRRSQKSVLERKAPPTFDVIVEILDREKVTVHADVAETVDAMLRGDPVSAELRWRDEGGVHRSQSRPKPSPRDALTSDRFGSDRFAGLVGAGPGWRTEPGWRGSGSYHAPTDWREPDRGAPRQGFRPGAAGGWRAPVRGGREVRDPARRARGGEGASGNGGATGRTGGEPGGPGGAAAGLWPGGPPDPGARTIPGERFAAAPRGPLDTTVSPFKAGEIADRGPIERGALPLPEPRARELRELERQRSWAQQATRALNDYRADEVTDDEPVPPAPRRGSAASARVGPRILEPEDRDDLDDDELEGDEPVTGPTVGRRASTFARGATEAELQEVEEEADDASADDDSSSDDDEAIADRVREGADGSSALAGNGRVLRVRDGGSILPTLRVLPHGISRKRLELAIRELQLPVIVARDPGEADVVMTLKSEYRQKTIALREAEDRGLPIYVLKSNTIVQMQASLTSIFSLEVDPREAALRETEEAIGMVIQSSEAVELSPQNAYIRRLQHQMAERANLISRSRGREPYRRVRLYP
jgi:stage III sporulation protein SpoIIIAA